MGKVLQIRVSAWTYNEDEVVKMWPNLSAVVWPEADQWSPPGGARGVAELAEALPDVLRFGDLPDHVRAVLQDTVPNVALHLATMRQALGDWEPRGANAASDDLEAALSVAETALREVLTIATPEIKAKKGIRFWC